MNCPHGDRALSAAIAERETVNALIAELVANGTDLRTVSLDDMKRRLATALRTKRHIANAPPCSVV